MNAEWLESVRRQGEALAAGMEKIQQDARTSAATLVALQRERLAEKQQLLETQKALKEALEQLTSLSAQAKVNFPAPQ